MAKIAIPEPLMRQFCQVVMDDMGLHYPSESWKDLEKKLEGVTKALGFKDVKSCLESLVNSPLSQNHINILAHHLTIGETYFFREERTFRFLRERVLPELIHAKQNSKKIRIWSAGCCSGEEPYSIAILLHQLIPHFQPWSIEIIGTDINTQFLRRAEIAHYKEWSFRTTPLSIKKTYFVKEDDYYTLIPTIKEKVKFHQLNLVENQYSPPNVFLDHVDLILCNNVLIYFSHVVIEKVVHRLSQSLQEGGWLCVTPIETPYINDPYLKPHKFEESLFFRKSTKIAAPAPKEIHPHSSTTVLPPLVNHPSKKLSTPILPKTPEFSPPPSQTPYSKAADTYQQGKYAITIQLLEPICLQDSFGKNEPECYLLIKSYLHQRELEKADRLCQCLLSHNKLNPILHYLKALILQEMNCLTEAMHSLKRALFLDPNLVVAHFALGNLLHVQGENENAYRHFRNIVSLLQGVSHDRTLPGEEEDMSVGHILNLVEGVLPQASRRTH